MQWFFFVYVIPLHRQQYSTHIFKDLYASATYAEQPSSTMSSGSMNLSRQVPRLFYAMVWSEARTLRAFTSSSSPFRLNAQSSTLYIYYLFILLNFYLWCICKKDQLSLQSADYFCSYSVICTLYNFNYIIILTIHIEYCYIRMQFKTLFSFRPCRRWKKNFLCDRYPDLEMYLSRHQQGSGP